MDEIKKKLKASINYMFKNTISDVDFDAIVDKFVEDNGYQEDLTHDENMTNLKKYIAIGLANKKF